MLKKLRHMRNDEKGFTLVELIVVLVILAILAALLIPALTGYIDKAKEKQVVAETRQVVMAAQTLVDEQYAAITDGTTTVSYVTGAVASPRAAATVYGDEIKKLAEVKGTIDSLEIGKDAAGAVDSNKKGVVTKVEYTSGGKTCTYTESDGQYTVTVTP